jgi:preprotein translocase subunit SecB
MPNFPLQLRRHFLSRLDFSSIEEPAPDPQTATATTTLALGANSNNPRLWRVALTVDFRYNCDKLEVAKGTIVIVGIFEVSEAVPEPELPRFVAVNGASLLYGAAREVIATVGGRAFNRLIPLPVMTFQQIALNQPSERPGVSAVGAGRVPVSH